MPFMVMPLRALKAKIFRSVFSKIVVTKMRNQK